jgi:hypothetical protein
MALMALMTLIIAIDVVAWLDITSFTLGCFNASRRVHSRCQVMMRCRKSVINGGWMRPPLVEGDEPRTRGFAVAPQIRRKSNFSNEKRFNSMKAALGSR